MSGNGKHVGNGALALKGGRVRAAMDYLNPRQRSFVLAYLDNGGNGVQAAKEAGFGTSYSSSGVLGHFLLKNLKIKAALREAFQQLGMTSEEVVGRLSQYARANPGDFVTKRRTIDWWQVKRRGHLIRKLTLPKRGSGGAIEMYNGMDAVVHIGRHIGMFADKLEPGGAGEGPIQIQLSVAPKEITG